MSTEVLGSLRVNAGCAPRIDAAVRMRFNPTLESVNLFIPGLIALVLTVVSALMSAISLSREKERGTLEILLVSPLRAWQIIVGKVVPYLVLGFANVLTVLEESLHAAAELHRSDVASRRRHESSLRGAQRCDEV